MDVLAQRSNGNQAIIIMPAAIMKPEVQVEWFRSGAKASCGLLDRCI
jgi:hypothetical protein